MIVILILIVMVTMTMIMTMTITMTMTMILITIECMGTCCSHAWRTVASVFVLCLLHVLSARNPGCPHIAEV